MDCPLNCDTLPENTSLSRVLLSLGSNIEQQRYLSAGLDALSQQFGMLSISSVYESVAVGFDGDNFFNLVVGIETDLSVGALSRYLKALEDENGRRRDCPRFSARTLDIDILTYDQLVGTVEGVLLPRQEILENAFVLLPLAELVPDEVHPVAELNYETLWQRYDRQQSLWPVSFIWREQELSSNGLANAWCSNKEPSSKLLSNKVG
jgi:2-amino-4-hydroxy-6-hydroxymethyldihydropteridine diphosphokinase